MSVGERLQSFWSTLILGAGDLDARAVFIDLGYCVGIAAAAWVAGLIVQRLLAKWAKPPAGGRRGALRARLGRVFRLTSIIARAGIAALALVSLAGVWGLDIVGAFIALIGAGTLRTATRMVVLVALAWGAYEVAGISIGYSLSKLARRSADRRRRAQLNTLGPLITGLARAAILVMFALSVLDQWGIRIGPLLAGAGVVGIAIGFGAQTVVKDVLTGIFLIVEDIVSVGDVIRVGESSGQVERMTLRTIRLRDFDGTLHVLPYGEAQVVHNLTKTFSYYVFDLQISYGSDIDGALQIMRDTGAALQGDPQFSDKILEAIEVVGVDSLGESGVVLKARIKTRPLEQWNVGREYNRRIKLAFDEAGIEIPYPHMKVVLPEDQLAEVVRH
ncbi:MAG TPA: mechanosensitive ion channel family protein [Caulobacteraceae bacterium]|nr:mechanosensitive ion channel family protein [Caulobacteraceae bacterium]